MIKLVRSCIYTTYLLFLFVSDQKSLSPFSVAPVMILEEGEKEDKLKWVLVIIYCEPTKHVTFWKSLNLHPLSAHVTNIVTRV